MEMTNIVETWLDKQLLQRVIRKSENDDSIQVVKLSVEPVTEKGDNFTSDILRVTIEFVRKNYENDDVEEKKSIIIKVCHNTSEVHRSLLDNIGIVDIEMKMLSSTMIEMEKFLCDTKFGGRCLYGQKDPPFVMIEDLKPLGFQMANRHDGLDLQHSIIAIRNLAKFHACSVAICEKNPNCNKIYKKGIFLTGNKGQLFRQFNVNIMQSLASAVKVWPGLGEYYSKKLMILSNIFYDQITHTITLDESKFNVINHGDCWINNMLFRYDENRQVTDQIFVDFQLCFYNSPAIDIHYFLNTSLAEEVLVNNRDEILQEYLKMLTFTMQKIGCRTKPPSMSDLTNMLRKYELYGLFTTCIFLPIMIADKKNALTIDEMADDDLTIDRKGVTNPLFLKRIERRLPIWDKMGILDIMY